MNIATGRSTVSVDQSSTIDYQYCGRYLSLSMIKGTQYTQAIRMQEPSIGKACNCLTANPYELAEIAV